MKFGSLCSGIGAPEYAWSSLGWRCEFAAEIEAFPLAVYAHHYPKAQNYGDITKFKEWPQHAIDVLVGGTPCQSFSVAGLRKGMADPRGNLALTFLAIVGKYAPAWVVWENVPGVLSIDEGRAFGSFLGGLAELGYGFAYRVLDAQYFGVAQRRRRVFVVGHAGGQWQRAAAVLFERESMCGNPAPRRETGQRIAGPVAGCSNGGGPNGPGRSADDADGIIANTLGGASQQGGFRTTDLDNQGPSSDGDGDGLPLIAFNCKDHGADAGQLAPTLRACPHDKSHANSGAPPAIAYRTAGNCGPFEQEDKTAALNTATDPNQNIILQTEPAHQTYAVRRLTPKEAERLQGFPDGYTAIQYRGKPACDGPRYKALGNSMAVPVLKWIGHRIDLVIGLCPH